MISQLKLLAIGLAAVSPFLSLAQDEEMSEAQKRFMQIEWQSEGEGKLRRIAKVDIPEGYIFTERKGTEIYLELTGNLVGESEMGIIAPEEMEWWALFEFDEIGYVKDDDEIEPDKLLKQMMDRDKAANEYRESQGLSPLWVDGWEREPFYNTETNNLEWALRLRDGEGNYIVNYQTKILGRKGVTEAILICSPDQLDDVLPDYKEMLDGFGYTTGNKYSEFKDGDKVAKYGLAALVVGGGAAVAAKTGLLAGLFKVLAKGGKAVIIGVIAVFAGIWTGVKRIFGRH